MNLGMLFARSHARRLAEIPAPHLARGMARVSSAAKSRMNSRIHRPAGQLIGPYTAGLFRGTSLDHPPVGVRARDEMRRERKWAGSINVGSTGTRWANKRLTAWPRPTNAAQTRSTPPAGHAPVLRQSCASPAPILRRLYALRRPRLARMEMTEKSVCVRPLTNSVAANVASSAGGRRPLPEYQLSIQLIMPK